MSGLGLTFLRRGNLAHPTAGSDYIKFKDEAVFNILMSKGVSYDGVGITKDDALKVADISSWFVKNAEITSFDEFRYFNNVLFIDGAKTHWEYRGFINCSALRRISLAEGIQIDDGGWVDIKGGAFVGSAVENIGNLDKVSYIGSYTFRNVATLSWVGKYNNPTLTHIGAESFLRCANFKAELVLPNLQTLDSHAFDSSGVTKVLNLGSITKVSGGYPAGGPFGHFRNCQNLTTVVLPETLTEIGDYAFSSCPNLSVVVCKSVTPPSLLSGFPWSSTPFVVYVPDASVADYHAASTWSKYTSRIKGISQLATDNPSLYEEIKEYL